MKKLLILLLPLYVFGANEPGDPSREIRSDQTNDASNNYSNPSYQGNTPPNDAYHSSPNSENYYDDPAWPNVNSGK